MRNKHKRQQREEVRKILAAIRDELAAHRMSYEDIPHKQSSVSIGEVITRARANNSQSNSAR